MAVLRSQQDDVLTLTIDRPEARNAMNGEVLEGLLDGLGAAGTDASVRFVVITGAGDAAFCAGADLGGGLQGDAEAGAIAQHEARGMLRRLFAAAAELDKPLIGRVNGHALAGGFGLALACDLLVSVDDATFGTPEVKVGLWPFVISALVVEHVGPKRALDMMMTGRRIPADEALAWGLVNEVVAREELDDAVAALCGRLRRASPVALKLGKRSYQRTRGMDPDDAMAYLHGMLDLAVQTEDVVEGITAFFEKRDPQWRGR